MQKYFESLYSKVLKRKPSNLYTLGDKKTDKLWGLDQNIPTFTPEKKIIDDFASMSYLYGLLGYTASNYTAIPAGYLVTYKKGSKVATIIISPGTKSENISKFVEEINAYQESETLTETERDFFTSLAKTIKTKNVRLLDVCLAANARLEKESGLTDLKEKREKAKAPFDSNDKNSVNSQNCDNNHILLERVCRDILGYPVEDEEVTEEQRKEAYDLSRQILSERIIPSYLTYVGKARDNTPIPRDNQVLTKKEMIMKIFDIVKTSRKLSMALTMCATDYTADVVCAIINEIINCKVVSVSRSIIDTEINPETPAYYANTEQARRDVYSKAYGLTESNLD